MAISRRICLFLGFVCPLVSLAALPPSPTTEVKPGAWCGNYHWAVDYATQNDLPLVMVWGKVGCTHCTDLFNALDTSEGRLWAAGQQAVFCAVEGNSDFTDNPPNDGAVDFAGGVYGDPDYLNNTPFVRFYWPGRKSVRFSAVGKDFPVSSLLSAFELRYAEFLKGIDLDPSYVAFPMGDNPCDRLEAVAGATTYVDVPLVRTNGTAAAISCSLVFGYKGLTKTQKINWAPGETRKFFRYTLPQGLVADEKVALTLAEAGGAQLAVRNIWCVGTVENSPKNPYWLGERTESTLHWGEWSMDLGIVTNKVKAWNAAHPGDRAAAMMFVGGSTWCPDCAMAEENFFSKKAFKDWAVAHKVVFGVLDIPNNPQALENEAWPSQLRYESSRASDAFVSLRGTAPTNELQRYQSGAGYLSRHSVPYAMATNIAARNAFLMGHDTLHGGWNRPERTNKNRTGVPVLILLRDDGTVAARWNRFSDVGPSAYSGGYLRRFEEMLALVQEDAEEANDDKSTTLASIESGDRVCATVSSVDQADVFAVADPLANRVLQYTVTGPADGAAASSELKVSVVDAEGTELAVTSGLASAGLVLRHKCKTADPCFLRVAPAAVADGTFFGYTNAAPTVCAYSLAATSWASGGDFGFTAASTNVLETCGTVALAVRRSAGSNGAAELTVRLAKVDGNVVGGRYSWTDRTLSWAAGEDGEKTVTLTLIPDGKVQGDMHFTFELVDLKDSTAPDARVVVAQEIVNVYDAECYGTAAYGHVACISDAREIEGYQEGDEIGYALVSGSLPDGIDVVTSGKWIAAGGVASGAPGERMAVFKVTRFRGGVAQGSQYVTFAFTVIDYDFAGDIPSLAKARTYGNLPYVDARDGELKGLLTISVSADGLLSAKYMSGGRTFAYACDGWDSFDRLTGTLTAVLEQTDDPAQTMTVVLDARGGVVTFSDPANGERRAFELRTDIWPEGASAWKGQYTVQLPQTNAIDGVTRLGGAAYMALRMVSDEAIADGSMLYAGVLPNGRAVYGCSVLQTNAEGRALLPFYHASDLRTAPYSFSGGLKIDRNAETDYQKFRWSVSAAWTPVWSVPDGLARASEFNVFGGYYDRDEITARFLEDFSGKTETFAFSANTASVMSGLYGQGAVFASVKAEMTADNVPQLVRGAANPQQVELSFDAETGVVFGNFVMPFAGTETAVTFRGIALPGWQGCSACSGSGSYVERPWAVGACAFSDWDDGSGFFRNGCEVKLDGERD